MTILVRVIIAIILILSPAHVLAGEGKPFAIVSIENHKQAATLFVERLRPAYEALGYSISLHFLPYQRSVHAANAGEYDAELLRAKGLEQKYPNLVMVPEPGMNYSSSLLHHRDDKDLPRTILELSGDELVYLRGTEILSRLYDKQGALSVSSTDQIVKMVSLGRKRHGMAPGSAFRQLIAAKGLDQLTISPITFALLYHYVHKRHEALIPVLARQLAQQNRQEGMFRYADSSDYQ